MDCSHIYAYYRGEEYPVQPPMMSFKAFLAAHDDSISDEEAVKKYAEYKLEFRRQQLNEFFTSHKDEEWYYLFYYMCSHIFLFVCNTVGLRRVIQVRYNFSWLQSNSFLVLSKEKRYESGILRSRLVGNHCI